MYIILVITLIAFDLKSQQKEPGLKLQSTDYFKKSKQQRTNGLLLLGSGAVCFGAGAYALEHDQGKSGYGGVMMLGGIGIAAASLPFFISSAIAKHKAKVSLKREALMITPNHQSNITYTSLDLRLNL